METLSYKSLTPYYVDRHKYIGEIDFNDGIVDITDPCYNSDTWCAVFGHQIKSGKYKCYIDVVDFPYIMGKEINHDYRIMRLVIIHEEFNGKIKYDDLKFETINDQIGVDAGLCGFYNHKPNYEKEDDWTNFWQNLSNDEYGNVCDCGENGITVSSGFGDGVYRLSEINVNGDSIALSLDFDA